MSIQGFGPKDPKEPIVPPNFSPTFELPIALVTQLMLVDPKNVRLNGQHTCKFVFTLNRARLQYGNPPVELPNPVRTELPNSFEHRIYVKLWANDDAAKGYPASGSWYSVRQGNPQIRIDPQDGFTDALPMAYELGADGRTGPTFSMYWVPHGAATRFHIGVKVLRIVTQDNFVQTAMITDAPAYRVFGRGPHPALDQKVSPDPHGRYNVGGPLPPR